jgi:hypothetical protein
MKMLLSSMHWPVAVALLMLVAPLAHANDKLAGEWVLDFEASKNLGPNPFEIEQTITIEGDKVKLHRIVRSADLEAPEIVEYTLDTSGEEHKIVGFQGAEREVTAQWKGKKLQIKWDGVGRFGPFDAVETWKKKKSGLEIKTVFSGAAGGFVMKSQFVRP